MSCVSSMLCATLGVEDETIFQLSEAAHVRVSQSPRWRLWWSRCMRVGDGLTGKSICRGVALKESERQARTRLRVT